MDGTGGGGFGVEEVVQRWMCGSLDGWVRVVSWSEEIGVAFAVVVRGWA